MKNSRKDGTLVVKLNKPYKMAEGGQQVERCIVLCKDIDSNNEDSAMDFEQMLKVMAINMPQRKYKQEQGDDENMLKGYYENECPSVAEVEENAALIEMMANMSITIKISELMNTFIDFVKGKLILLENGQPMPVMIWNDLTLKDKLKIMYCYTSFFVNPLQKLAELSTKMGESERLQDMQGKTEKIKMPSGSQSGQKVE